MREGEKEEGGFGVKGKGNGRIGSGSRGHGRYQCLLYRQSKQSIKEEMHSYSRKKSPRQNLKTKLLRYIICSAQPWLSLLPFFPI